MISGAAPVVSIVTATYNWSSVLRCAIESARMQTFADFELLVVGDGCTDDSEAVVKAFEDPRLRWMNLPANSGGQAVPNNCGIAAARGEYIAYLGHDDIWYPTHLETLVETIRRTDADLAGSVAILYGPPGSGVRTVSGVFGGGEFSARDFMPPSFILHKRSLTERIGGWRPWAELRLPTDIEFEQRALASGARIVSSGVLTAFKFNAAWRRNSYLTRSSAEQEQMLARIRSGVDFRQEELIDVLRSVLADRYVHLEVPSEAAPGEHARRNARFKGTAKEKPALQRIDARTRFRLDDQLPGFEWHGVEVTEQWGSSRWSGAGLRSTLEFPVCFDRETEVRIHVLAHMQDDLARDVRLFVDDARVDWELEATDEGTAIMRAVLAPRGSEQPVGLALEVAKTQRPFDLGMNADRRRLGIAISWVEFVPVEGGETGSATGG